MYNLYVTFDKWNSPAIFETRK